MNVSKRSQKIIYDKFIVGNTKIQLIKKVFSRKYPVLRYTIFQPLKELINFVSLTCLRFCVRLVVLLNRVGIRGIQCDL